MGVPAGVDGDQQEGREMGKTNPLIALRAHDELSGRSGREGSIEGQKND